MRFVAATDSPDGGRVAPHLERQRLHPLSGSRAQEDPCVLDLEPRTRAAVGNHLEDGNIINIER